MSMSINVWIKGEYCKESTIDNVSYEYICSMDKIQLERYRDASYNIYVDDRPTTGDKALKIIVTKQEWHRIARLKMAMDETGGGKEEKEPVSDNMEGMEV